MPKNTLSSLCLVLALLGGGSAQAKITTTESVQQHWLNFANEPARIPVEVSAFPYASCFEAAAQQQQLPLALLLAVAKGESTFNRTASPRVRAAPTQ